jgi:carbonic anhydrase
MALWLTAGTAGAEEPPKRAPTEARGASRVPLGREAELALESDPRVQELLKQGATAEDAARVRGPRVTSPEEAVRMLKSGNARFFSGTAQRPELAANQRRAQIFAQTPFAAVLGCADSRVPTEIVYDQGLGDIFTARVAGNVAEPSMLGSLEYAVRHLKPQVVVVMGHEGCGAVQAAMLPQSQRQKEPENVRQLLEQIAPAVEKLPPIRDAKARNREAVIANVRLQVHRLRQNPVIAEAERQKRIVVIGAYYELSSGAVDFLETQEALRVD